MRVYKVRLFDSNVALPLDEAGVTRKLVVCPDFRANVLQGLRQLVGLSVTCSDDLELFSVEPTFAPLPSGPNYVQLRSSSIYVLGPKHYILVDCTSRVALLDQSNYRPVAAWFESGCPPFYLVRHGENGSVVGLKPVAEYLASV